GASTSPTPRPSNTADARVRPPATAAQSRPTAKKTEPNAGRARRRKGGRWRAVASRPTARPPSAQASRPGSAAGTRTTPPASARAWNAARATPDAGSAQTARNDRLASPAAPTHALPTTAGQAVFRSVWRTQGRGQGAVIPQPGKNAAAIDSPKPNTRPPSASQ